MNISNKYFPHIPGLIYFILCSFVAYPAQNTVSEKLERFIVIEAPCELTFPAADSASNKAILVKPFQRQFVDEYEMVNAESAIVADFEAALNDTYPNSRVLVKDIMVYMLDTQKEAKQLYARKRKQFKLMNTAMIPLKMP